MNTFSRISLLCVLAALAVGASADYQLVISEAVPGSVGQAQWKGVRRFYFYSTGGFAGERAGIDKADCSDAAGVFVAPNGQILVGNRHGNSGPASVGRFGYSATTDTISPLATITGNSMSGAHGVVTSPANSELFVSNVANGVSRFLTPFGTPVANGVIRPGTSTRGVFMNPTGTMLYITEGVTNNLVQYELATGTTTPFAAAAGGLHFGSWRAGVLYVAGYDTSTLAKVVFDANGKAVSSSPIQVGGRPLTIAFSPDGNEMYVGMHATGVVERYSYNQIGDSWSKTGQFQSGTSIGDMSVLTTVPTSVTISGQVALTDVGNLAGRKVAVTFYYDGRPQETVSNVTLDAAGKFSLTTTRRGAHFIGVKASHWLRKKTASAVDITGSGATFSAVTLQNGDCDGNNLIGTDDYLVINGSFDLTSSDVGYDARADLNEDGYVGTDDYLIFNAGFDDTGD